MSRLSGETSNGSSEGEGVLAIAEGVLEKEERNRKERKKKEKENHKEGEREEEAFPPLFSDLGGSRTGPTHFKM